MSESHEFVKVATTGEVPEGKVMSVDVSGKKIAICHCADGFFAIADLCTHDNAPLDEGELIGCQIECPRHGARFDVRTGAVLCLPAVRPVPTYPLELRGEEIWICTTAGAPLSR